MSATVTINTAPLTGSVLEGVTIRYGRENVTDQVPSMTATLTLLAAGVPPAPIALRDLVQIGVDGVPVFYGKVTDRVVATEYADAGTVGTLQTITAVGPLADLGRTIFQDFGVFVEETDGLRAKVIAFSGGLRDHPIGTLSTGYKIANAPWSFDSYLGSGLDAFDAGTVTLLGEPATAVSTLELFHAVANSAGAPGVYETPAGRIGYCDARRRTVAPTALTLDAATINADLAYGSRIGDLLNTTTVTYGSPAATVTATVAASVSAYGEISSSITTTLATLTDAQKIAEQSIAGRATPRDNLESLTVQLDHPDLSPLTRAALLGLGFGSPLTVTGLPAALGLGTADWKGFVEGWTLVLREGRQMLTLNVSARIFSLLLATVDALSSTIDRLEGTIADLAVLWAPVPLIDAVTNTINSLTAFTLDRAYDVA